MTLAAHFVTARKRRVEAAYHEPPAGVWGRSMKLRALWQMGQAGGWRVEVWPVGERMIIFWKGIMSQFCLAVVSYPGIAILSVVGLAALTFLFCHTYCRSKHPKPPLHQYNCLTIRIKDDEIVMERGDS